MTAKEEIATLKEYIRTLETERGQLQDDLEKAVAQNTKLHEANGKATQDAIDSRLKLEHAQKRIKELEPLATNWLIHEGHVPVDANGQMILTPVAKKAG